MTYNFPTREIILQHIQADFVANLTALNPFLQESWTLCLLTAIANAQGDFYDSLVSEFANMFPDTATGDYARAWGNFKGADKLPAAPSRGFIDIQGTVDSIIPQGTQFQLTGAGYYDSIDSDVTISTIAQTIYSLSTIGSRAYVVMSDGHQLASGLTVTVSGAVNPIYNVTAEIVVTSATEFNYPVASNTTPESPTAAKVSADFAVVKLESQDAGRDTNVAGGASFDLSTPIVGVNSTGYSQYDGLTGGADAETDLAYKIRYKKLYSNPQSPFSTQNIENTLLAVPGITRVFVFPITPDIGDATIYFVRDNDVGSIIPSPQEVADAKDALALILPANTFLWESGQLEGIIVKAPTPKVIDFQIANLVPDSFTMRQAIQDSLIDFFRTQVYVGVPIPQESYRAVIYRTIDPQTGNNVQSFSLSNPVGDIDVQFGELPILGDVTFG